MKARLFYEYFIGGAVIVFLLVALLFGTAGWISSSSSDPPLEFATPFSFTPFTENLPLPPVAQPVAPFEPRCSLGLPEGVELSPPRFYEVTMREATAQIIPGVDTLIWGYDGLYPGPTFVAKHNEPAIVRFHNDLDVVSIVHNHGGHTPAESDGSASVMPEQLILPGEFRDFCYPNIAPIEPATGEQDMADFSSTQWYHDHAHRPDIDLGITGQNVYMGLAGFFLLFDELEEDLIQSAVLPAREFDIPLVLQDRVFAADGSLLFAPEVDNFDGVLGDVFVINGKAQPKLHVQRRKYRFRILNGATARWWELRLSSEKVKFLQIGSDSWLIGEAMVPVTFDGDERRENTVRLGNAERADVVIDFRNAPDEVFLENIIVHDDGRRPDRVQIPGTPILKFVVEGDPLEDDVTVDVGTPLRPHTPIRREEIVRTRIFEFERSGGQWAINGESYDFARDDAVPEPNTAERWILRNKGGSWAHPLHIHLEAHQIQSLSRREVAPQERFKKDTVQLEPNEEAEVFIKFRTFTGRYVFHCHNLQHEDLAMMFTFNVGGVPGPGLLPEFPEVEPISGVLSESALERVQEE